MGIITNIMRNFTGDSIRGRMDFFRYPDMKNDWGGPFNGQKFRQRIFFDILYSFPITAIVETGTYHGTTTALFAATSLPVYTVEINPRHYSYSKTRFFFNRGTVLLSQGDSCSFLRGLRDDCSVPGEDVFFYLDAHWEEDLPLREELEIIFSGWERPIVMIDDFGVRGTDYGFDDYGEGKVLNLSYITPVVSAHSLSVFFPAVGPSEETGAKRGCVVLCRKQSGMEMGTKIQTLVQTGSFPEDTM